MNYLYRHHKADDGQLILAVLHPDSKAIHWSAVYPSFIEDKSSGNLIEDPTLIDLGVMKSVGDIAGLEKYLKEIQKIEPGDLLQVPAFAQGGLAGEDLTDSLLREFEYAKHSHATYGDGKWVNRIPKTVTSEQLSFIPTDGSQEMDRISNHLIYGLDKYHYSKDQKRFIVAGLKTGKLKIIETPSYKYRIIHSNQFAHGGITAQKSALTREINAIQKELAEIKLIVDQASKQGTTPYYHGEFAAPILWRLQSELSVLQSKRRRLEQKFASGGRLSSHEDNGGKFALLTPEAAIARIKKGEPLINIKDDYRVQYNGGGRYAISFPSGLWETLRVDENELSEYLTSAFKFAKGGKVSGFDKLASSIGKKLIGKKVPKKYQKEYGKIYDKKDAKQAGKNIAGSIVNEKKEEEGKPEPKIKSSSPLFDKLIEEGSVKYKTYSKNHQGLSIFEWIQKNKGEDYYSRAHKVPGGQYITLNSALTLENVKMHLEKISERARADKAKEEEKENNRGKAYSLKERDDITEEASARENKIDNSEHQLDDKTITRAEAFFQAYGVTPETLYNKVKELKKQNSWLKELRMAVSAAATPEHLPGANYDAINQDNSVTAAEMMLALIESPMLNELNEKFSTYGLEREGGELFIPSSPKPAPPKPTPLLESFASLVSKDDLRPAMMGVYLDEAAQQMAATNAHILGVKKTKIEGKSRIIAITDLSSPHIKAGEEIDARYPDYKVVIPQGNALVLKSVIVQKLYEQVNGIIKANRLFESSRHSVTVFAHVETPFGDVFFDPGYLHDVLKFFFRNGVGQIDIEIDPIMKEGVGTRGVILRDSTTPTTFALIMPIMGDVESASHYYSTLHLGEFSLTKDFQKKIGKGFLQTYHRDNYELAKKKNDKWGMEYHAEKMKEEQQTNEAYLEKFNVILRAKGMKEIPSPYKHRHEPEIAPTASTSHQNLLEDETGLLPAVIADGVANKFVSDIPSLDTKKKLKVSEQLQPYLYEHANVLYRENEFFKKKMNLPGNEGRDALYAYMAHWAEAWWKDNGKKFEEGGTIGTIPHNDYSLAEDGSSLWIFGFGTLYSDKKTANKEKDQTVREYIKEYEFFGKKWYIRQSLHALKTTQREGYVPNN